ncbi:MAG: glycosyltransferase [Desulfomonilaceae bacterium]
MHGGDSRVSDALEHLRIAVLIPCRDEEESIGTVVRDLRRALPGSIIYVYDNNSTDRTVEVAIDSGAKIGHQPLVGKGNVVNRMFSDIDADVYILIDGDDTYDAASAPRLVETLLEGPYDMVTAVRVFTDDEAYRSGHQFGNVLLTRIASILFEADIRDMLSGYRAFSYRFIKSFACISTGFEIETELTFHALDMRMPIAEIEAPYRARREGSVSKLRTFRDGFVILFTLIRLLEEEKPLTFFGIGSILLGILVLILIILQGSSFLLHGSPIDSLSLILTSTTMIAGLVSLVCGLILNTVTRGRKEMKRLRYLSLPKVDPQLGITRSFGRVPSTNIP